MPTNCHELIEAHAQAWDGATRHAFLERCANGTILPEQFNTWLLQDYLFVVEFTRMAAQVLTGAPVRYLNTILGGLAALKDELNWFRDEARERGLNLNAPPHPTCWRYGEFMKSLSGEAFTIQAVALWTIECAYNQAWRENSPMVPPYDRFAERWGNPDFSNYVALLEEQADEALEASSPRQQQRAEQIFLLVTELERDFWDMAFAGAQSQGGPA